MKWFKHDSDASKDAKLKRLIMKYGMEGYGLYWYCLELIVSDIESDKITFELEHDAEIISFDTGIHYERVQEMMVHMVKLGLFEESEGVVRCLKLAKRLDKSMTSNSSMRNLIEKVRKNHDGVMIDADKVMQEEKRLEEIRREKKEPPAPKTKPSKTAKPKTSLPNDFAVTESMAAWFSEQGFTVDIKQVTSEWKDYIQGKGKKQVDWIATWRNGMRKAQEFSDKRNGKVIPINHEKKANHKKLERGY